MRRRLFPVLVALLAGAGCVANPSISPTPSATGASTTAAASVAASLAASPAPSASSALALPAIDDIGWWGVQQEAGPDGPVSSHLTAGVLGRPASIDETVPWSDGFLEVHGAGDVIGVVTNRPRQASIAFWSVADGRRLGDRLDAAGIANVAIDPARRVAYLAIARNAGGIEIRRDALDGTVATTLIELDKRFTPDGIPVERFDLTVDPDGTLLVEACARADGCRVWTVPAGAVVVPKPVTLRPAPPILCHIVGATREWLVVTDDAACTADTADAPLPIRAISRADGTSHLVADGHLGAGRVLELRGTTSVVANDGAFAGATIDIVSFDVASGRKTVHLHDVPPGPDDSWLAVSPQPLPGPWVLLEPVFIEASALPTIPARLLDLETNQTIELPMGTFGWR
jgi:hypothetical protein